MISQSVLLTIVLAPLLAAILAGIAGKVIGGKTGAIIGGIAGAAGGAVVANKTADRDVVVRAGMAVSFTLSSDFTITRS